MHDVIIVGGGISAFSSALFAARRGLKVLVIGKDIGGQANFTDTIENFPGIEQIGGFELTSSIRKQAENYGSEFLEGEVEKLTVIGASDSFVIASYGRQYKAESVILAFGKTPRDLNVPGEQNLKGRGVTYCANCDGPLYKNKIVAVAGIGNVAADAGLLLSRYAKKVFILSKTDKFVAHPALTKALFKKNNVELVPNIQIQQLLGENSLAGMQIMDLHSGKLREMAVAGLFVELGYVVDSKFVENIVKLDEQGQIETNINQSTSVPGIFAAGDATSVPYKQAVISAGQGAAAALACFDWLMRKKGGMGLSSDWTEIKRVK